MTGKRRTKILGRDYLGVVPLVDELPVPVPDEPDVLPDVPPDVEPLLLPDVPPLLPPDVPLEPVPLEPVEPLEPVPLEPLDDELLGVDDELLGVLDDELLGVLDDELLGVLDDELLLGLLMLPLDELGVVELVSEDDDVDGVDGVVTLLLLLLPGVAVPAVLRRSQPLTPATNASTSALVKKICGFIGKLLSVTINRKHRHCRASRRIHSQVRCHLAAMNIVAYAIGCGCRLGATRNSVWRSARRGRPHDLDDRLGLPRHCGLMAIWVSATGTA